MPTLLTLKFTHKVIKDNYFQMFTEDFHLKEFFDKNGTMGNVNGTERNNVTPSS